MRHRNATGRALTLLAALALGTAAQAQSLENFASAEQSGADNTAEVTQSGQRNTAGAVGLPMDQDGYFNQLVIEQTGQDNSIAASGAGLVQDNLFGTADHANSATLSQTGDQNVIGEIVQQVLGVASGAGNRLTIDERDGDGNIVSQVEQVKEAGTPGQNAEVTMSGFGNRIDLLRQVSGSDLSSEENDVFVFIDGENNGTTALSGYAGYTAALASEIVQRRGSEDTGSNGNQVSLQIYGASNAFGVLQRGRINRTGAIVLTGDGNAIGVEQDGTENDIILATIEGDNNEVGLSQLGTNVAELSLEGISDDNQVLIDQMGTNDGYVLINGHRNEVVMRQGFDLSAGGDNDASIRVEGDDNLADLTQQGDNRFTADITGSSNNTTTGFSMPQGAGYTPGTYVQIGLDNTADVTVLGDANLSAFFQQGIDNMISLEVIGSENEALLLQFGNGNAAGVTQTGRANVAVVMQ
ncbi:hypothetical protein [Pseudooceanicola nanhaiensis]|uniref:hypothetical protein n=1 Tax=Pseudooceanicola nanhaiensis TaxID=375761 RepID=UPI001CD3D514|nr:hypothetical protein [Pseudooceanicola nanhaiensis]MCA0922091.1 hypothetical protein [Pseudooceanicola nanhaiensis]